MRYHSRCSFGKENSFNSRRVLFYYLAVSPLFPEVRNPAGRANNSAELKPSRSGRDEVRPARGNETRGKRGTSVRRADPSGVFTFICGAEGRPRLPVDGRDLFVGGGGSFRNSVIRGQSRRFAAAVTVAAG